MKSLLSPEVNTALGRQAGSALGGAAQGRDHPGHVGQMSTGRQGAQRASRPASPWTDGETEA